MSEFKYTKKNMYQPKDFKDKNLNVDNLILHNITKIIKHYYSLNQEVPEEIINNVNFLQKTNIEFMMSSNESIGNYSYNTNETLALNIIKNLPLDAYKQYVTLDWMLDYNNDDKMIYGLMSSGKFDVIKHFITLAKNENIQDVYQDLFEQIYKNSSSLIYNSRYKANQVKYIENLIDFYKEVMPEVINAKNELFRSYGNKNKKLLYKYKNFYQALKVLGFDTYNNKESEFLLELITKEDFFSILEDIIKNNKEIKGILLEDNYINQMLKYGNRKLIDLCKKEMINDNIKNEEEINEIIILHFENKLNYLNSSLYEMFKAGRYEKEIFNIDATINLHEYIKETIPKYNINQHYYNTKLLFINNKESILELDYKKIKIDNLTANEWMVLDYYLGKIEEYYQITYKNKMSELKENNTYPKYIISKIKENYPEDSKKVNFKKVNDNKIIQNIEKYLNTVAVMNKNIEIPIKNYISSIILTENTTDNNIKNSLNKL